MAVFLLLVTLFNTQPGLGQFTMPDTLLIRRLQEHANRDTVRANLLLSLAKNYVLKTGSVAVHLDSSERMAREAESISEEKNFTPGQGNAWLIFDLICNKRGRREEGKGYGLRALHLFEQTGNLAAQAEANIIVGQFYGPGWSTTEKKIVFYQKAAELFARAGSVLREASVYQDIGDMQTGIGHYAAALDALKHALERYQTGGYSQVQAVYDLIGLAFTGQGDYINGLKYSLKAVQTAEYYRDQSPQLCPIYNRTGLVYFKMRDFQNALQYFQKSLDVAEYYRDTASMVELALNISNAYLSSNNPQKALAVLRQTASLPSGEEWIRERQYVFTLDRLALFDEAQVHLARLEKMPNSGDPDQQEQTWRAAINYAIAVKDYARAYRNLDDWSVKVRKENQQRMELELLWFRADSATGKSESAIRHFQAYKALEDSMFNVSKSRQTAMLQIEFDTEKKADSIRLQAKNISELNQKAALKETLVTQTRTTRNLAIAGAILLLLLLLVLGNRYRTKQRTNIALLEKQAEISSKNERLERLLHENEWLLREVHHRVKNNLQIVMSLLNSQSAYLQDEIAQNAIKESQHRVQSMSLIHQKLYKNNNVSTIHMPEYISDLVDYLKDSFRTRQSIYFDLQIDHIELEVLQAVPVGLILNELITNAIKYAFPNGEEDRVKLRLFRNSATEICLVISDNGRGMPEGFDLEKNNSFGIILIKGLAEDLGGRVLISSAAMAGTTITVIFKNKKLTTHPLSPAS